MTIAEIRNLARLIALGSNNTSQVSDANALSYMNIVYHDMEARIISEVNEDFFFDTWTANTVATQSEYTLPYISGSTPGLKKILGVSVKWESTDTYFVKLSRERFGDTDYPTDWLTLNVLQKKGFFRIADQSIFVYPAPLSSVAGGLIVDGIRDLPDLLEADAAVTTAVKIPTNYHRILSLGMIEYIYLARQLRDESLQARSRYEDEIRKMIFDLSNRYMTSERTKLPITTSLE